MRAGDASKKARLVCVKKDSEMNPPYLLGSNLSGGLRFASQGYTFVGKERGG